MSKKIIRIKQSDDVPNVCNGCLAASWNQCYDFTITMRQLEIGDCREDDINYIYVIEDTNDGFGYKDYRKAVAILKD